MDPGYASVILRDSINATLVRASVR